MSQKHSFVVKAKVRGEAFEGEYEEEVLARNSWEAETDYTQALRIDHPDKDIVIVSTRLKNILSKIDSFGMSIATVQKVLRRITYKPDHELKWKLVSHAVLQVWWEFERPDCLNPSEWGTGRSGPIYLYVNDLHTPEQVVRAVFGMTMRLEEHEAREFFQYGDDRPFDPHKELI